MPNMTGPSAQSNTTAVPPYEIDLAIIGGTGFYHLDNNPDLKQVLKFVETIHETTTPWGKTSSPVTVYKTVTTGKYIGFLSRHGLHHEYSPTTVPYGANMALLKHLKVKAVVAFSSVGSLKEELKPGDFVIPDQLIDRTKGVRQSSYFNETGLVGHVSFGNPFCKELGQFLHALGKEIDNHEVHYNGTLICMEGPQFSTRAESLMYKSWGSEISVINMSCVPESKLARELELPYQMVCMVTDYDSWRLEEHPVTIDEIKKTLQKNNDNAFKIVCKIVTSLDQNGSPEFMVNNPYKGHTQSSISTKPTRDPKHINEQKIKELNYIFPEWV